MTAKVTVVTPPDDIICDAKRILLFDPTIDQTQFISDCLMKCSFDSDVVFYIWRFGESLDWLYDKMLKYDLVIMNAETPEQGLLGYLFAKPHSYYLGNLRSLCKLKKNNIIDADHLNNIFKERLDNCE